MVYLGSIKFISLLHEEQNNEIVLFLHISFTFLIYDSCFASVSSFQIPLDRSCTGLSMTNESFFKVLGAVHYLQRGWYRREIGWVIEISEIMRLWK